MVGDTPYKAYQNHQPGNPTKMVLFIALHRGPADVRETSAWRRWKRGHGTPGSTIATQPGYD